MQWTTKCIKYRIKYKRTGEAYFWYFSTLKKIKLQENKRHHHLKYDQNANLAAELNYVLYNIAKNCETHYRSETLILPIPGKAQAKAMPGGFIFTLNNNKIIINNNK